MSRFKRRDFIPLCGCGCGESVKWNKKEKKWNKYIHGHYVRVNHPTKDPNVCKKISKKMTGENNPMRRPEISSKRTGENNPMRRPEVAKKQSESLKVLGNKHPWKSLKYRKAQSKRMMGNQISKGYKHTEEVCKLCTERMLNGQAAYMNSFIKNPSKPQVELFKLVKQLYPNAILNYPSLNRSIDIAIPNQMIAIEYDGSYWHQDQKADKKRQIELEDIGWKFLRYCDYVPKINELRIDLNMEGLI